MTTRKETEKFKKNFFEDTAWAQRAFICGVDEVGRGCLAGPVVAGAVILPPHKTPRILKDSKLLDHNELEIAYAWIVKNCWFAIGIVHNRAIDHHNIYQASLRAMRRAVMQLYATAPHKPSQILIDAMPLKLHHPPFNALEVIHFIKGESKSSSIAAASIVAKVTRDRIMRSMDPVFPGYGLASHKGYATPTHRTSVKTKGRSIIHRVSFLNNIAAWDERKEQVSIWPEQSLLPEQPLLEESL